MNQGQPPRKKLSLKPKKKSVLKPKRSTSNDDETTKPQKLKLNRRRVVVNRADSPSKTRKPKRRVITPQRAIKPLQNRFKRRKRVIELTPAEKAAKAAEEARKAAAKAKKLAEKQKRREAYEAKQLKLQKAKNLKKQKAQEKEAIRRIRNLDKCLRHQFKVWKWCLPLHKAIRQEIGVYYEHQGYSRRTIRRLVISHCRKRKYHENVSTMKLRYNLKGWMAGKVEDHEKKWSDTQLRRIKARNDRFRELEQQRKKEEE